MSPTTELETAAAALAGVDWATVGGTELLEASVALGRLKAVVHGALVAVAERLEETRSAEAIGWASTKDFLTHVTGGRKGTGAGLVRVAQHTADLPEVRAALAAGSISLAQAGVIGGRVTTLPHDLEFRERTASALLDLVDNNGYDATDLDRCFPQVAKDLDTDGLLLATDLSKDLQERGAHGARYLCLTPDTLGGVRIKGYASLEEAELVKTTLMTLTAPVVTEPGACGGDPTTIGQIRFDDQGRRLRHDCPDPTCAHDGRDTRDHGVRLWDALVEACRRLQATDTLPHAHATAARITLTISYEELRHRLDAHGLLPTQETLSAAVARRLACDTEIIPAILGTQGQVLDVGRTNRLVTTGIWTALVLRDQHCAFPGCTRLPLACDAHHIIHWADQGTTSLDNLILLCRKHHTLTHQTPWQVQIDPNTRRPVWIPPPPIDDTGQFTYTPARPQPPLVA